MENSNLQVSVMNISNEKNTTQCTVRRSSRVTARTKSSLEGNNQPLSSSSSSDLSSDTSSQNEPNNESILLKQIQSRLREKSKRKKAKASLGKFPSLIDQGHEKIN